MDKYRFTLQFPKETSEQIRAGEFLGKLGRKKSLVIVAAINEYLDNHLELDESGERIAVNVANSFDEEDLRKMVARIIQEDFSGRITGDIEEVTNKVADSMLDGMDAFL